jgi:ABC-2 type transport system permease protein
MEMLASPMFAGMSASEIGQVLIVNQFLFFFLMIPLIIPTSIAAYSIVGEKQQRSLEPLLATPVSTGELLLGKSLAAALPAVGVTWLAYAIFITAGRFVAVSDRVFGLMVAPMWLLAIGVLAPLFTVLAVNIAVIVSSRVNEPRVAEQLSGLVVLPIILVSLAFIVGRIMLTLETFTAGVLITVVIDVVVLYLGVRLFQRETILTKWK